MIRHLPILKSNDDIKAEIIKKVDKIINYLETNKGIADEIVYNPLRKIDEIIFSLYGLDDEDRELIISNIKNQIMEFYYDNIQSFHQN